jgi:lambda family phage portal protein
MPAIRKYNRKFGSRAGRFSGALRSGNAWEGASKSMRRLRTWTVSTGSPDGEIISDLPTLRQRSRDLVRNEPFGRGAVNVLTQAVIGRGLKPQSVPDVLPIAKALNADPTDKGLLKIIDSFSESAEWLFKLWGDSQKADVRGQLTFSDLQESAFKNYLQSGDIFFTVNIRTSLNYPFRLRIGLIEADQVENPFSAADSRYLRGGIELNKFGEPIAYHVNKNQEVFPLEFERIPKYGPVSKRQLIWHLFKPERIGNTRGVPFLAPVIVIIKNKNRYAKAELDAAINNSILAMMVKSNNTQALTSGLTSSQTNTSKENTGIDFTIAPGAQIVQLRDGEDIVGFNPNRPYNGFEPFLSALAREVGMALNIPYEILLRQFNSSYTASRAAYNMFERTRDVQRNWFNLNFDRPIWQEVITEEILAGRLEAPGFIGGDYFTKQAWLKATWAGDSIGQINPVVETDAAAKRVANQFSTTTAETAGLTGGDYGENLQTLAREREARERINFSAPDSVASADKTNAETEAKVVEAKAEVIEAGAEAVEAKTEAVEVGAEVKNTE